MKQNYFINSPAITALKANIKFAYCTCGLSETLPLCNGSHRGTEFKPIKITPEHDIQINLCRCSKSNTKPECDGSHLKMES
jgi:CDGSH-type Zn-finger protein